VSGKISDGADWIYVRKFVDAINILSQGTGHVIKYLIIALILVLTTEVTSRYVFNSPTIWVLETSKMLLGIIGTWGWAYTHKHHGHVRVDILYTLFPRRIQALVDVILSILMLFPLVFVLVSIGTTWAIRAWVTGEKMVESSWLPPAAPFRTLLVVGFIMFALQCIAQFLCDLYCFVKNKELI
jgi:TRAP-type mannitol/chloroaromatic compound transport system permease small subunit